MATWDTVLVERLRYYINDIDSTAYDWTDVQLQKFLAIGAVNVFSDLAKYSTILQWPYTINTATTGSNMISPDPLNDLIGISNLLVINAGCIIARSTLKRTGAAGGWKIIDDKATIDGTQSVIAAQNTAKTYCDSYSKAIEEFKDGNAYAGSAVLSPYQSSNMPLNNGYTKDTYLNNGRSGS